MKNFKMEQRFKINYIFIITRDFSRDYRISSNLNVNN